MLQKFETLSCLDMQIRFLPWNCFNFYTYAQIIYFLFSFNFYHSRAYKELWKTKENYLLSSSEVVYLCSCKEKPKVFISNKDQFRGSFIEAIQLICIHEVNRFFFSPFDGVIISLYDRNTSYLVARFMAFTLLMIWLWSLPSVSVFFFI